MKTRHLTPAQLVRIGNQIDERFGDDYHKADRLVKELAARHRVQYIHLLGWMINPNGLPEDLETYWYEAREEEYHQGTTSGGAT